MIDFEEFRIKAQRSSVVPVVTNLPADLLTPLGVYLRISDGAGNAFLLESVEGGETLARYSFIGAAPFMTLSSDGVSARRKNSGGDKLVDQLFFDYLREHFAENRAEIDHELPAFIGGAIGFFGFSAAKWFEPTLSVNKAASDAAALMFFRSVVAFDHARQQIKVISLAFVGESRNDDDFLVTAYKTAVAENTAICKKLDSAAPTIRCDGGPQILQSERGAVSNWTRAEFESAVRRIQKLILDGECYQVVLSQVFRRRTSASDVAIYRALRSMNPSPYMFLLRLGERSIVGSSPEMLVRTRGDNVEYRPIAGTRPRGKSADEDASLADEMRNDHKEVAEHTMLVDLGRNDLGRVADFGSVSVDQLMKVEKYSHVQHLVTNLSARLWRGADRFDAFAACFPAGTVSGAPKLRAIEIIESIEPEPRGVYAGAVGYFDYSGNMDTCIAIRTLVLENGIAKVQSGAGIVADSVPELEYVETKNKALALLEAIDLAEAMVNK